MIEIGSLSDQLYTWSDINNANQVDRNFTPPPQNIAAPAAATGAGTARLPHRTLQALWQTRLQMRTGSRPRAQALPLGQSHRRTPGDGLRPSGVQRSSLPIPGQLPADPHDPRRVGCDQPRTTPPPRGVLNHVGERHGPRAHRHPRPFAGRYPHCQYARSVARSRAPSLCQQGGKP